MGRQPHSYSGSMETVSISSWIFSYEGQEKHYSEVTDLMSSAKQSHKEG